MPDTFPMPTPNDNLKAIVDYAVWPRRFLSSIEEIQQAGLQENSEWYRRIYGYLDLELARGDNSTACYALGGIGDTLGSMYGEENLLLDMMDNPQGVKHTFTHIKHIWIKEYQKQASLIKQSGQAGMCGWSGAWAPGGTFPVQEDMSCSISPELYDRIVLPELMDIFDALDYPMYHLDGKGAIGHLESLLKVGRLKAIQWAPGAGNEEIAQWYPLIKRILDAGKSVQISTRAEELEDVVRNLGTRGLLINIDDASYENMHYIEKFL